MARYSTKPIALHQLLEQNSLASSAQHAQLLRQLNTELIRFLQLEQSAFCKISTIKAGRLMILCQSPAWATRLKMQRDAILANFRQKILPELAGIDIEVSPNLQLQYQKPETASPKDMPKISEQAADYLLAAAETMDGQLKEKLQRLAELARQRSAKG
ncbi:DUF721 domain-containing protein [Rheinheimera sp.]|uniref:DUF721 domain-containing protein n=1 Tax=Rheinheimera sp. TaxID=1869214 RepID=UPI003AF8CC39